MVESIDRLKDSIQWFSKKPVLTQLSMIDLIIRPGALMPRIRPIHLLSTEDRTKFRIIIGEILHLLTTGETPEEEIVDVLVAFGLDRIIAQILVPTIKETRIALIKDLTKLPPNLLREYMEEAIPYLKAAPRGLDVITSVEFLARRHKLLEIPAVFRFLVMKADDIGHGRTTFEEVRAELQQEGFTGEQIDALLTPMIERFDEIRQTRGKSWKSRA